MNNRNKIRRAPLTAFAIAVIALLRVAITFADNIFVDPACPSALRQLTSYYQKAAVNSDAMDPLFEWAVTHGGDADSFYRFAVANLENRVVEIIETLPPGHRSEAIDNLSLDSGLSVESIQVMIDYYALRYYEEPRLAGDSVSFWDRVESLNRDLRITEPKAESPESRYLFYLHSLTLDSVPEIARKLGISESKVRSDLSQLKLSVCSEFHRGGVLEEAKRRFELNQPIAQIAGDLKLGEQALRFVLHYEHELNRGSQWNSTETATLLRLVEAGATYAKIADALNQASNRNPQSTDLRSEGAVAAKVDQLQLTIKRVPRYPADISLPKFGNVKRNGHLTEAAKKYIRAHFLEPLEDVADQLGVAPKSLAAFIRRHDLIFRALPPTPEVSVSGGPLPTPTPVTETVTPAASHVIRKPNLPTSPQSPPVNPTRGKQVLAGYKNIPEPEKLPTVVLQKLPNKPLNQLTLEELDAALLEIANTQFGGLDKLTLGNKLLRTRYSAAGSTTAQTGVTILRAWAINKHERDNPKQPRLNANRVFGGGDGGKKMSEWIDQLKASHGFKPALAADTRVVMALQNKPIADHSLEELDAAVLEIAHTQFGGVENLNSGKFFKSEYAAPGAVSGNIGHTIFKQWAVKKRQRDNPDQPLLNTVEITNEKKGGKKMKAWLEEFKTSHGQEPQKNSAALVTVAALQTKPIQNHSFEELDAVLLEIAKTQFGSVENMTLGDQFRKTYAAPGANSGPSGRAVLSAWAVKKYQADNATLPPLNTIQIFEEKDGGKTPSEWMEAFKNSHGYVPTLLKNTVVIEALQNKPLQNHSLEELDAALLEIAVKAFGGVETFNSGSKFAEAPFAAPGATSNQLGRSIIKAWAIKKRQRDHPSLPPLNTNQIVNEKEGGKTLTAWAEDFRTSHGHSPKLSENVVVIKSLQNKQLQSHSFEELDAALLEIAVIKFGGVKNFTGSSKVLQSQYAAPGATSGQMGKTILSAWAIQKRRKTPNLPPLNTHSVFDETKGGKKIAKWIEEFKQSHQ